MKPKKYRALASASLATLGLLAALVLPGLAAGEATTGETSSGVTTIEIKMEGKKMGFFGPKTVHEGEELRIVNTTNPKQVGPHTFTLVTKGSRPRTAKARKTCFTPGKICKAVVGWYGLKGEENPKEPFLDVGAEGWDTMGTTSKKGDSWFTDKKGEEIEAIVSAKAGTTLYFMCIVHSFMQGSIKVLPSVSQ